MEAFARAVIDAAAAPQIPYSRLPTANSTEAGPGVFCWLYNDLNQLFHHFNS